LLFDQLAETNKRIDQLADEITDTHKKSETSQRLATIPGVGGDIEELGRSRFTASIGQQRFARGSDGMV
jgi:hypothetical protein